MKHKRFRVIWLRRILTMALLLVQIALIAYPLISRSAISSLASVLLSSVSILACLYIISRRDKGAYKLTWVFLIMLFPVFGGVFYLVFGLRSKNRWVNNNISKIEQRTGSLRMLPGSAFEEACAEAPDCAPQIRYLQDFAGFPIYSNCRTEYLSPGEEKLERLLEELEKAEKYIFLEYFIVEEGQMWGSVLDILKRKAAGGVKVRLLYDDMGCFFRLPKDYPRQLARFGIECRAFNPFVPLLTTVQNNRDHRKIAVIDGKVAFTGGVNMADEYINAVERFGHWKDASIMVEGAAAWSFTVMFLQMWELCTGRRENYSLYYPWTDEPCPVRAPGYVLPYTDSPLDRENVGEHVYLQIINKARDYVYITTPYLIVDDSMVSALCLAAKSGVDVRIITPHKWDKKMVHICTRSYYRDLISSGVKIYEYTRGFIHSKTFVSDDRVATVGTTNLDFRSLYLHFECGVWMYGCTAVDQVKADFLRTVELCQPISERDCRCGLPTKLLQDVLRLFAPLM